MRSAGRLAAIETRASMLEKLTPRENEILALLADGATNDGVARELAISPRTVQVHLDRLYRKLGSRIGPARYPFI
jgi:DNA-binding NarL/FixJ family response regulator